MTRIRTFGPVDRPSLAQLERCLEPEDALAGVLCADHHLGYSMPIGGVIAYREHVSPSGVGYDIGCGNLAVQTTLRRSEIQGSVSAIMHEITRRISFGIGRTAKTPIDDPVLDEIARSEVDYVRSLPRLAADQLGTVGAGNHYVDVFADEDDAVWVGVHFGSRGFGHKIATHYLALGGGKDGIDAPPTLLSVCSSLGQEYLEAMRLAGAYAQAGRKAVVAQVVSLLGANVGAEVHNHHNFAWQENVPGLGGSVWVVRKGSTPNGPGQLSFVGGSMGSESYILRGLDSDENSEALNSTIHGAGRAMSRTEAAGKFKGRGAKRRLIRPGKVDWAAAKADLESRGIVLRGGAADEAPQAYKSIGEVLSHHAATVSVEHVLTPLGVAMAGVGTVDPYKD